MGAYINPVDETKESWLQKNATLAGHANAPKTINDVPNHLPVCLVNNGPFTAAGIAFDERELAAFIYPDGRYKEWYWVETEKLMDPNVSDLHYYLKDKK